MKQDIVMIKTRVITYYYLVDTRTPTAQFLYYILYFLLILKR